MFTLWYTVLTYREYRSTICEALKGKTADDSDTKNAPSSQPPKKEGISKIPVIEPVKPKEPPQPAPTIPKVLPPPPQPQVTPKPTPPQVRPPQSPPAPSSPSPSSPQLPKAQTPLLPPAKPPRSPSPHPINAEMFDDIDFEDEESEQDEDENSVIDSPWIPKPAPGPIPSAKDFLNKEITSQRSQLPNQQTGRGAKKPE